MQGNAEHEPAPVTPAQKIVQAESGSPDAFDRAQNKKLDPVPEKYVSSRTVADGEGLRFRVTHAEVVVDRFDEDKERLEPKYVFELEGTVLESRARKFRNGTSIVVACRSVRLEELANANPQPGDTVALVHGGFEGTRVEWKWDIDREEEVSS